MAVIGCSDYLPDYLPNFWKDVRVLHATLLELGESGSSGLILSFPKIKAVRGPELSI